MSIGHGAPTHPILTAALVVGIFAVVPVVVLTLGAVGAYASVERAVGEWFGGAR